MATPPDPFDLQKGFQAPPRSERVWEDYTSRSRRWEKFTRTYGDNLGAREAMEDIGQASHDDIEYFDETQQALDYLRSNSDDYLTAQDLSTRSARAQWKAKVVSHLARSTNEAAPITDIPTTTTNPERPRTVAAGWESYSDRGSLTGDSQNGVLTVVFRDGTYYNYYDVSRREWNRFRTARSKGLFILTFLDAKRHGGASVGTPAQAVQATLYRIARTAQMVRKGGTKEHPTPPSYSTRKNVKQFQKPARAGKGRYLSPTQAGYGRGGGRYVVSKTPIRQGQPPNRAWPP